MRCQRRSIGGARTFGTTTYFLLPVKLPIHLLEEALTILEQGLGANSPANLNGGLVSTPVVPTGLLIGGEWLQTDSRLAVMDPSAESVLAEVGDASVADGLDAVAAASDAFGSWSLTPARQRAYLLK